MRNITLFLLSGALTMATSACRHSTVAEKADRPIVQVSVVEPETGPLTNYASLSATTVYLKQNVVTAPISGYLGSANVAFGQQVHQGQLLYTIETNERKALGQMKDSLLNNQYGIIKVYATISGVINKLERQQKGEYVTEGSTLCSIADNGSLAFEIFCPYEYTREIRRNSSCEITLPDSERLNARIGAALTQVAAQNQAQAYLAKPDRIIALPESLVVAARIITYHNPQAQMLPAPSILSDELMHHFWVMKLVNDSVAVKTPVVTGKKAGGKIEILSPHFLATDRIINQGNYGLTDTAYVRIH